MKTIRVLALFFAIVSLTSGVILQEKLTAKQIMDKAFEVIKLAGSEAVSTLTIIDSKGRKRIREIAMVTKLFDNGDTEKRLLRFLAPPDVKGTGLLVFDYEEKDDDMWLFMPALRKTRRIVSSERAKSFMGSEFSYADMSPPILDEFTYKILSEKEVEGTLCWEIEMVPVNEDIADENGFSRRIAYIGKEDYVIRGAHYYDLDGEKHKELSVLEIKELDPVNHRYRPLHMVMVNTQNNRQSILKINSIQFNPGVKDDYFTTRYLERY